MVKIRIKDSNKCFGEKSLFISFDYSYILVNLIKSLSFRVYHPNTKEWEVPVALLNEVKQMLLNNGLQYSIYGINQLSNNNIDYSNFEFKTKPMNHQLEAINFGLSHNNFLLGDDMGLGKTKEALDISQIRKMNKQVNKCLIICGVNALKWNWKSEIAKHTNDKSWILGMRKNKKGRYKIGSTKDKINDLINLCGEHYYMITNIESLRSNDFVVECKKLLDANKIQMIIFDEAHCCKNPESKQTKGLMKLNSKYKISLSGTFMLNNPLDLYVPLKWSNYYKDTYYKFKYQFLDIDSWGNINGLRNIDVLRNMLSDCMLRRRKEEVIDLPEKTYINEVIEMTDEQRNLYDEVIEGIKLNIDRVRLSPNPLVEMIRARQATGYPGIISSTCLESAKMNRLIELVDEITTNGYKCIVFSNWAQMIEQTKVLLSNYNPAIITGEYNEQIIEQQKDKFKNDSSCKVCCGTIGKMGTGLTLTEANYVIFLDEPWNKGIKEQAADRVHRIGQKNNVTIITLLCKDTIDERINDIVEQKGFLTDLIVDGKYNTRKMADYLLS